MRLPQRTLPLAVTPRHLSSASGTAPPEAVDLRSRPMSRATRLGRLGSKSYKWNITCECGKRAKPYLHHARREELCRISHSTAQTETSRETPLPTAVTYPAAVALVFWCVASFVVIDALVASLERVEFESASQPFIRATAYRAFWPSPTARAPFPLSLGCMAVPGCMRRRNGG
jgi:hypothetical protein